MRRNYDDAELAKRKLRRLDIDPTNVEMGWMIDFCAQSLRNIVIGLGGKQDGFTMQIQIRDRGELRDSWPSFPLSRDLKDLRERLGNIVVAYDKKGKPVTTTDLEVAGAMCAWM